MIKLGKTSFGFSAVQAGQKNATVNAEPRLVANSTQGKFQITAPVSKAMNIAVGDNVMFINNIAAVEQAISQNHEDIVAWANENGVDLTSREGQDAALEAFTVWGIAKGLPQFDSKGNPVMVKERYTKEDKLKYIQLHAAELVEANREALIERVGNADASDEELVAAITPEDIESPTVQSVSGSKTATTSNATGVGCQLNFTDTAIWGTLKANLGDDKTKKNRIFAVLLDEGFEVPVTNGYEEKSVMVYPIEFKADEDPIVRGEK